MNNDIIYLVFNIKHNYIYIYIYKNKKLQIHIVFTFHFHVHNFFSVSITFFFNFIFKKKITVINLITSLPNIIMKILIITYYLVR